MLKKNNDKHKQLFYAMSTFEYIKNTSQDLKCPLMSATGCSRCSISLLLRAPSSLLWCPGVRASKRRMQTDWINSSKRQGLLLALSLSPWRRWWRTGCCQNCWQSWTLPLTPPHRTLDKLKSSFNNRLIQARCLKECHRKSFLPGAIRLYNCAHYKTQNTQNCCSSCYLCGPNFPLGINKVIDRLVCLCIFASMKDISSIYELSPSPQ